VTTAVDLTPIITPLIALAGAILTAAAGAITAWLANKAKDRGIVVEDQQKAVIETAIRTSVGMLVTQLAAGTKPLQQITIRDPDVRAQVQRIVDAVPTAITAIAPSADTIAAKIVAGVGHAIAGDPAVPTVPVTTAVESAKTVDGSTSAATQAASPT
jgi:hypothetical protein